MLKRRSNPGHLPGLADLAEWGTGEFEDYYPSSASGEIFEEWPSPPHDYYSGRRVVWIGTEGRMIRAQPEYLQHIWGNIFDQDKLAAVASGISSATGPVGIIAPYGQAGVIDPVRVKESIEYAEDEGLDEPYTTGDEELDAYLTDPGAAIEERADLEESSEEEARALFEAELAAAVAAGDGDLGEIAVTVRDGNHRAFGALLGGEPYVYVMLMDNDYQRLMEGRYPLSGDDKLREALE